MAFEKGFNAIPGAMAYPVNSWAEFKKALRELKTPEAQEKFETIIIDTADIAYSYVEKYVCNMNGVDKIADIPFGGGYIQCGTEFDEALRLITQLGYGLVIISHATDKTFTNENGTEFNQIVPTLSNKPRLICQRLCDIIGYSRGIEKDGVITQTRLFMRGTSRFIAGSRFKYTPDSIEFTYDNLVGAIADAIDKQQEEDGASLFTDEKAIVNTESLDLNFDQLMAEFSRITTKMVEKDATTAPPIITDIVNRYLGRGKRVADATRDQVEQLDLIVSELTSLA